jgi:hypothetical protein
MNEMENTYTYIARNATAPEQVMTFTLYDHHMEVELGAPLEQVGKALQGLQREGETQIDAQALAQPAVAGLMQWLMRPFHIADVNAHLTDNQLRVIGWTRAAGLRLAPVVFMVDPVDNPDAAQAFVDTVNTRQQTASQPGEFPGLLDYWLTWALATLGIVLVLAGLRKKVSLPEDDEPEAMEE